MNTSLFFQSHVTQRVYSINHKGKILNCKSKNIIYLITCKKCNIQYVGETTTPMRERVNKHRATIKKHEKDLHIVRHFSTCCSIDDLTIQPIEYINDEDGDKSGALRRYREKYWMNELRTIYPYGLNERCGDGDATKNIKNVYSLFNKMKRKSKSQNEQKKNKKKEHKTYYIFNSTYVMK